jgi:predicted nucleic acid-binding protein
LKIGLDTSCIVPIVVDGSDFHQRTYLAYDELKRNGAEFVIANNALLEAFSVLTRSPDPFKTAPAEAERLLHRNFDDATIAGSAAGVAWAAIRHTISRGYGGSRVYDAAIALATYEAGARLLLTWNVRHFHSVAPVGLEVREP